jgi:glycogen operon protein
MLRHDGTEAGTNTILTAYNGWTDQINFKLTWPGAGKSWHRVTDTAAWNEFSATPVDVAASVNIGGENVNYGIAGRSLVIFIAK